MFRKPDSSVSDSGAVIESPKRVAEEFSSESSDFWLSSKRAALRADSVSDVVWMSIMRETNSLNQTVNRTFNRN